MKRSPGRALVVLLVLQLVACATGQDGDAANASTITGDDAWTFEGTPAWQDEFDYTGRPDPAKWGHDLGGDGWGNHELQAYTDRIDNASVGDGVLTITAHRQDGGANGYTSARLVSKGKGDFLYGRIEARAKLPSGRGTWPAIWMLPTGQAHGGWPASGEIDIMEHVGYDPGRVHVSVHAKAYNHVIGTQKTSITAVPGAMSGFHRYRVDWTPAGIRGYIDDAQVFAFANEGSGPDAWPFDRRFHLLLNLAVGGDWGGKLGVDADAFPASMQVDYVRVYRLVER
ncbi:MAG TPA: glycoside hydrolase family 16 protein [Luteimonas sp.]